MTIIFAIIGLMLLLDVIWWIVFARLAKRRGERIVIFVFMFAMVFGLIWIVSARLSDGNWDRLLPKFGVSAIFIWHFICLGLLELLALLLVPILLAAKITRRFRKVPAQSIEPPIAPDWSRREFLKFAGVMAPPAFTLSLTGLALHQLNNVRVRRFVLPIAELPAVLDGTTIAQVSDLHVGRFTKGRVLQKALSIVNEMRTDLVLSTGDLINDALADLETGLVLTRAMQARFGVAIIEGNHDLIENPSEFETRVKASGIPFLLDESCIINVRGFPVQLLGLSWTRTTGEDHDAAIAAAVDKLLGQRQPEAFPILMAHHPHAFDAAAAAGMPLTLSGHTHGGQLMLNERTGFGPALFRYWSGLYTRGHSRLIVSNGIGNWFPLRINAPAEIVHITLKRA